MPSHHHHHHHLHQRTAACAQNFARFFFLCFFSLFQFHVSHIGRKRAKETTLENGLDPANSIVQNRFGSTIFAGLFDQISACRHMGPAAAQISLHFVQLVLKLEKSLSQNRRKRRGSRPPERVLEINRWNRQGFRPRQKPCQASACSVLLSSLTTCCHSDTPS